MRKSRRIPGYTVIELAIALGMFALILLFTTAILVTTKSAWVSSDSEETAATAIRRALTPLEDDFSMASAVHLGQTTVPPSLGAGMDGDAIWFLSPIDPATGQFVQNDAGQPVWQRNILYYLAVPLNHSGCTGLRGPDGYDDGCPHKVLVRKVINNPGSDGGQNLLTDVASYLTRPRAENDATATGPGLESSTVVGNRLLWFRVLPDPAGGDGVRVVDARAVALEAAQGVGRVASTGYAQSPYTHFTRLSLWARN